jgi:hypothetical protein
MKDTSENHNDNHGDNDINRENAIIPSKKKIVNYKNNRPTFVYRNNSENHIRAGGLILYRYDTNMEEFCFLMIKSNGKYEDFGGRTEKVDSSIEDTICREADEESNGILRMKKMLDLVENEQPIYCNKSKYMVYIIHISEYYNPKNFGVREFHDDIPRTVEWVPISKILDKKFVKYKLHIRLKFMFFFKKIKSIKKRVYIQSIKDFQKTSMFLDESYQDSLNTDQNISSINKCNNISKCGISGNCDNGNGSCRCGNGNINNIGSSETNQHQLKV